MSLVSVVVPMYNAEGYISATLASILQEQDVPLEVVVVNDGSTDTSLERVCAIGDKRVRVVNGSCKGVAAAMNVGLAAARGGIIVRCDADDLYPVKRLAQQVDWLSKHPEFGAVCGSFATINTRGRPIARLDCGKDAEEITEELCNGITRTHLCTFAMRVEVLQAVGGFRQYFHTAEDIDLQLRIGELCRVWYLPDIQYHYRLHGTSLTHTQSNVEREFFESTAREFQRQRNNQGGDDLQRGYPPTSPQGSTKTMKFAEHVQGLLIGSAWREHGSGKKLRALIIGMHSVIVQPSNMGAWRGLLTLAVKPSGKDSVSRTGGVSAPR